MSYEVFQGLMNERKVFAEMFINIWNNYQCSVKSISNISLYIGINNPSRHESRVNIDIILYDLLANESYKHMFGNIAHEPFKERTLGMLHGITEGWFLNRENYEGLSISFITEHRELYWKCHMNADDDALQGLWNRLQPTIILIEIIPKIDKINRKLII
jgi:hypothetical protein